jgi:hypothetical protein
MFLPVAEIPLIPAGRKKRVVPVAWSRGHAVIAQSSVCVLRKSRWHQLRGDFLRRWEASRRSVVPPRSGSLPHLLATVE